MRTLRVIREALIDLVSSTVVVFILISAVRELRGTPNANGLWAGLMPITERKWPWLVLILLILALVWHALRRLGGARGILWGAAIWLRRLAFCWSMTALVLFASALVIGLFEQPLSSLNWHFAIGYLSITLGIAYISELFRRRMLETHSTRHAAH